jgi:hypothetical protein
MFHTPPLGNADIVTGVRGLMISVRFDDPEKLASCANYLRFAFPGEIKRTPQGLDFLFTRGDFQPSAERAIVERLLWAWRTTLGFTVEDAVVEGVEA